MHSASILIRPLATDLPAKGRVVSRAAGVVRSLGPEALRQQLDGGQGVAQATRLKAALIAGQEEFS